MPIGITGSRIPLQAASLPFRGIFSFRDCSPGLNRDQVRAEMILLGDLREVEKKRHFAMQQKGMSCKGQA